MAQLPRYRVLIYHPDGALWTMFNYGIRSFALHCQRHWEYERGWVAIVAALGVVKGGK